MLSIGIVGLPNVGKSTLFNALTQKAVPAENFPFCTIDPAVGVVAVPDPRLSKLSEFSESEKTIPAAVEFVDIAGLVKGAAEGEGLGNQFLANIREVDAILHVVRIFDNQDITHVHGDVDPVGDIGVINLELILADLETVTKRLSNLEKEVKRGDKEAKWEVECLTKVRHTLEEGHLASATSLALEEEHIVKQVHLLTMKPMYYALNKSVGSNNIDEENKERWQELEELLESTGAHYVIIDAGVENELADVAKDDQIALRRDFGVLEDGLASLIQEGYKLLKLITYFTTGTDETRAWTIKESSTAPIAGTAIHTDFRDKFIRAEVIPWDTLLESGSYAKAREKGLLRTEGKEYIVKDGDVVEFKI
ncbi:MAG: redox-regulated ATPase YchF [Candidatus Paceibacterota bacterium]